MGIRHPPRQKTPPLPPAHLAAGAASFNQHLYVLVAACDEGLKSGGEAFSRVKMNAQLGDAGWKLTELADLRRPWWRRWLGP